MNAFVPGWVFFSFTELLECPPPRLTDDHKKYFSSVKLLIPPRIFHLSDISNHADASKTMESPTENCSPML